MMNAIEPAKERSRTDAIGARLRLVVGTTASLVFACWAPAVFAGADEATANAPIAAALLPSDLSPWGMFLSADVFVKAVMVTLAFASFVTWTVALAKAIELMVAARKLTNQIGVLKQASTIADVVSAFKGQAGTRGGRARGAVGDGSLCEPRRRRRQGTRFVEVGAGRGAGREADGQGDGPAGDGRRDRALRWIVWDRLGRDEQLHRHIEAAHHQPRSGRAGNRGSVAGDGSGTCRRDPSGRVL